MARLLWANILPLGAGGSVVEVMDWWNIIEESDQWQSGICFALCAAYSLLSVAALVQLGRIQLRVPEYGWTTQKFFHLMNFVVNGSRVLLLGLYQSVFLIRPKVGSVTSICCACFMIRCALWVAYVKSWESGLAF